MKILRSFFLFPTLTFVFFATSCTAPQAYKNLSSGVDSAQTQLDNDYHKPIQKLNTHPQDLVLENTSTTQQTWLKDKVSIHAKNMNFQDVANRLIQGTSATNSFDKDINPSQTVTMDFKGTRENALNTLSAISGYAYTLDDSVVNWSTLVTKTFDVSFMPGASKYMVGENSTAGGSSGSSSGSSGSGSSGNTSTNLGSYGEYSSMQGDLSIWKDLESTITGMLSDKGKVNVSQATTTITVTDKPTNIRNVQNYLANMNQSLSRQVVLDVQVIEITLNKSFNYGIDWNQIRSFVSGRYQLKLATPQGASGALNSQLDNSNTFLFQANSGIWNGSKTFIDALATEGKVSVSTQPRVVTLNNQVAEIGINTQTTYLASVSTTSTAQVGSTTALTPSSVTTGFTLYILPKVQGDDVYLQITSTLANLVKMQTLYGTTATTPTSSTTPQNQIEAPIITQKRFNERALVPSNTTLVLAGFKQLRNEANKNSLFGEDALGGHGGNQDNIETIVLITPTIINNSKG